MGHDWIKWERGGISTLKVGGIFVGKLVWTLRRQSGIRTQTWGCSAGMKAKDKTQPIVCRMGKRDIIFGWRIDGLKGKDIFMKENMPRNDKFGGL